MVGSCCCKVHWVPHSRASRCIYFICVQKTGRQFPQPPQSQISGICNFWGLWLAALAKGVVHWVWFLTHLPLDVFIPCAPRTQVEGSHNTRIAKSRKLQLSGVAASSRYTQLFLDPGRKGGYAVATQTCKAVRSRRKEKTKTQRNQNEL